MLSRDANSPSAELLDLLRRAHLLHLLLLLLRLTLALEPLGQLARLELGWCAVEDVERLDAIVDDAECAVEEAHEM